MTATLTAIPSATRTSSVSTPPAARLAAGQASQGHLPRPVRRVPLQVVAAPAPRPRSSTAVYGLRRAVALVATVVLLVAVLLVARAGLAWLGGDVTAGDASPVPTVLVAGPGDSYWSMAGQLHAGGDLRSTVDTLVAANGGRELRVGDRLVLAR